MSIENIRSICRFKKLSKEEKKEQGDWLLDIENKKVSIGQESFNFNDLFDENSSQDEVYEKIGKQAFYDFLDGYDTFVITYGKIGSGKTYTMVGSDEVRRFFYEKEDLLPLNLEKSSGLIPRLCSDVINQMQSMNLMGNECVLRVSYIENYLNTINCLISGKKNIFKGWGYKDSIKYKENQEPKEVICRNIHDIFSILCKGQKNAKICSTKENADSSRSHTFFILDLDVFYLDGSRTNQKMFLVDLAGSDRAYDHEVDLLNLKENKKINQSLFILKSLIRNLARGEKITNGFYKQSILTGLLKNSIGGNAKTYFVVCVNKKKDPEKKYILNDNILTLRFGVESTKIKNKVEKKIVFEEEEYKLIIEELKEQVKILRGALKKTGLNYHTIKADSILLKILKNEEYTPIENLIKETRKLKKEAEKIIENQCTDNDSQEDSLSEKSNKSEKDELKDLKYNLGNQNFDEETISKMNELVDYEENQNEEKDIDIDCSNPVELIKKYQLLERKYKLLVSAAGSKISKLEERRQTLMMQTDQFIDDIKVEAVTNLNEVIESKIKEISSLSEKIEELKVQIMKKENEMSKKILDAQKENNELKYRFKKIDIENNSLNDFILTYQSDILLLQSKIDKKRKKINLLKETIKQLTAEKENIIAENSNLKLENASNQEKIILMTNGYENIKLELENLKCDKENLDSLYESLLNSDKTSKEKISSLKTERNDLLTKSKEQKNSINDLIQQLKNYEAQAQNVNEFICKFCKNRQSLDKPENIFIDSREIEILKETIEDLENKLKNKTEEIECMKNEKIFEVGELEKKIKLEISKNDKMKLKFEEICNKQNASEMKILTFQNKEKDNENLISSLKNEILLRIKEKEILEEENLNLKNRIDTLESDMKLLMEKNNLTINKLKEDIENERINFNNENQILKSSIEDKSNEALDWESKYNEIKNILQNSENTKNDLELKVVGLEIQNKIIKRRDTIMFMTGMEDQQKDDNLEMLKQNLEEKGKKTNNIFNVKLKKVPIRKESIKSRKNSGISYRSLLKKKSGNKFLEEARAEQKQIIEKTKELIESSNNRDQYMNLKNNIIYKYDDDVESFESDGSLIFPDVDEYSDLEAYNEQLNEFTEKKKTYNLQKKIQLGKELDEDMD